MRISAIRQNLQNKSSKHPHDKVSKLLKNKENLIYARKCNAYLNLEGKKQTKRAGI